MPPGVKVRSLSTRLALSYLGVVLIGMGLVAPLAWLSVEQLYQSTQRANLKAQARLIAAALATDTLPAPGYEPYAQASNLLPGIHTRVIDPQGAAVISLSAEAQNPSGNGLPLPELAQNSAGVVTSEELLSRPEIEGAIRGQSATAIRRVGVAGGGRVLYAAAPVLARDGSVAQIVYLAMPLPDTQWAALPVKIRWQLGGAILAAVLVASGTGTLLARRISTPLRKFVNAAHAVADGDLGQTVPEDAGITELTILGRAFNTMTGSLRQAEAAKNAFIADVSHELRTPLTVIKGTIETLQDGALDDLAARGPFLDSMNRETERLIRLVNDLLVLTRADAGALNLKLHPVNLGDLARSRCEHMGQFASQHQVRLEVVIVPQLAEIDGCLVIADADRIAQVLDNLLDNAIRYSLQGGEVKITVEREGDQVACRVADSGPGIPAQHLPFIFERFYRVDPARGHQEGGSGLGLAIVRSLVAAHGGNVAATSEQGRGTTLTFWLPAAEI